jgi:hypothetical protein
MGYLVPAMPPGDAGTARRSTRNSGRGAFAWSASRSMADLGEFLTENRVIHLNLRDTAGRLQRTFGWSRGVPHSILIDREGRVAHYWSGGLPPDDELVLRALADTIIALLPP